MLLSQQLKRRRSIRVPLTLTFNQLVAAAWNLRRIGRMEAELCAGSSYNDLLANHELQNQLDRLAATTPASSEPSIVPSRS
jgi:hypothetical protein